MSWGLLWLTKTSSLLRASPLSPAGPGIYETLPRDSCRHRGEKRSFNLKKTDGGKGCQGRSLLRKTHNMFIYVKSVQSKHQKATKGNKRPKQGEKRSTRSYHLGKHMTLTVLNKTQSNSELSPHNYRLVEICHSDKKPKLPGLRGQLFP